MTDQIPVAGAPRTTFPALRQVVLDATDPRTLAEFYRRLLGFAYRPGDEPGHPGSDEDATVEWLVLADPSGSVRLAFQRVDALPPSTWPEPGVPQQLHLDLTVPDVDALDDQHRRALDLGARLLEDRADDAEEPLRVYADPAGHPFCLFVAPD